MKTRKINKFLGSVCSFCMACAFIMQWGGCSILFFGEYPFPENDNAID